MKKIKTTVNYYSEQDISDLIWKRGVKVDDRIFYVSVKRNVKIEFDGRKTDYYEQMPVYVSCLVTSLYTDIVTGNVWFNAVEGFSTQFPNLNNENYNLCVLGQEQYRKIVAYLKTLPAKKIHRKNHKVEWQRYAESHLDQMIWPSDLQMERHTTDFSTSVDCYIFDILSPFDDDVEEKIRELYFPMLDKETMVALKIKYPDIDAFENEMWLCRQDIYRKLIMYKFIDVVMKKVWKSVATSFIKNIYEHSPSEFLNSRYKSKMVFLKTVVVPEESVVETPSIHKIKRQYTLKDFSGSICSTSDLWVGATYGLCFRKNKEKEIIAPVILKKIKYVPHISIDKKILNIDIFNIKDLRLCQYFRRDSGCGDVEIDLVFENQITHEDIEIKKMLSNMFSRYHKHDVIILMFREPYRYPNIENEYIKKEEYKIYLELCNCYSEYVDEYIESNSKSDIETVNINGLEWSNSNIRPFPECSAFKLSTAYAHIPSGYRLPTTAELVQLMEENPYQCVDSDNPDIITYMLGDNIKIFLSRRDMVVWNFWSSDTYRGSLLDPVKVCVDMHGHRILKYPNSKNMLLLVKK